MNVQHGFNSASNKQYLEMSSLVSGTFQKWQMSEKHPSLTADIPNHKLKYFPQILFHVNKGPENASREKIIHGNVFIFVHKNVYRIRFQEIKNRIWEGFELGPFFSLSGLSGQNIYTLTHNLK